jgi:hypothetical protein
LTVAIVVVSVLLGVGIVVNQLLRLREWLKKPPPDTPDEAPGDTRGPE